MVCPGTVIFKATEGEPSIESACNLRGSVRMILAVSFIAGPAIFLLTVVPFGWALGALLTVSLICSFWLREKRK